MSLGAGPNTIKNFNIRVLPVEVAVTITSKVALTIGDCKSSGHAFTWIFGLTNVCLVIAQPQVFGPELSAGFHGHSGFVGHIDHDLIQALGMHVDLDDASCSGDRFEKRLPERIAALWDSA